MRRLIWLFVLIAGCAIGAVEDLPIFNHNNPCPKCGTLKVGHKSISYTYDHGGNICTNNYRGYYGEHFDRKCPQCQYGWAERIK